MSSDAIVGTNDANVWIGFNLGTGAASQANWVNVTGGNTVLPNRPVLGIALDPSAPTASLATGYAAVGGFNANTPTTPGHVFQVVCTANCASFTWADKTGNLPDIPVDSIIVNPNFPQQVFAGTRLGPLLHRRHHRGLADLVAVRERTAPRDDLGHADRPRVDDALGLDARPRRLRLAAAGQLAAATATAATATTASATTSTATASTSTATATTAAATSTSATATASTATSGPAAATLSRAERARPEAGNGEGTDPGTALPSRHGAQGSLPARRPCRRPEPTGRLGTPRQLQGQPEGGPALTRGQITDTERKGRLRAPFLLLLGGSA